MLPACVAFSFPCPPSFNEIFNTDRRRSSAAAAAALDADTTPAPSRRTSALNGLFSRRASAAPALAMANTAAAAGSERDHRRRSSVHQAAALLLHAALDEADGGGEARGGAGAAWLPLRADDVVMLDKFKCNQVTTWHPLGLFSFHVVCLVAMLSGPPPPNRLLPRTLPPHFLSCFSPLLGDIIFYRWCATSSRTP